MTLRRTAATALLILAFMPESIGMAIPTPSPRCPTFPPQTASLEALLETLGTSAPSLAQSTAGAAVGLEKLSNELQAQLTTIVGASSSLSLSSSTAHRLGRHGAWVPVQVYFWNSAQPMVPVLSSLGMRRVLTGVTENLLEGEVTAAGLVRIAGLPEVRSIVEVWPTETNVGSAVSEGDFTMRGPRARNLGPMGAGIKVGIISDSFSAVRLGESGSRMMGDLVAPVDIREDERLTLDEGRALAEVATDTAPEIERFVFHAAKTTSRQKVRAIKRLVRDRVDVIIDDSFRLEDPFFQDGEVALAADEAVRDGDVVYVVSAGNHGAQSYESGFDEAPGGLHDFAPGLETLTTQVLGKLPGTNPLREAEEIKVVLQWDDPWGEASRDLDVCLVDLANPTVPLVCGLENNRATTVPREVIRWKNTGFSDLDVGIKICLRSGTGPVFLKHVVNATGRVRLAIGNGTESPTVNPDAASARGTITVGAIHHAQSPPTSVQAYSSKGFVTRRFDPTGRRLPNPEVRIKPEVVGPDCVSTSATFLGGRPFGGRRGFCGTSAAVAGVGGVAALMRSVRPVTAGFVKLLMVVHAIDIEDPGPSPDPLSGWGFIDAQKLVRKLIRTTPTPSRTPSAAP